MKAMPTFMPGTAVIFIFCNIKFLIALLADLITLRHEISFPFLPCNIARILIFLIITKRHSRANQKLVASDVESLCRVFADAFKRCMEPVKSC